MSWFTGLSEPLLGPIDCVMQRLMLGGETANNVNFMQPMLISCSFYYRTIDILRALAASKKRICCDYIVYIPIY